MLHIVSRRPSFFASRARLCFFAKVYSNYKPIGALPHGWFFSSLCPSLQYELQVASRAYFSTCYLQLIFTVLTVGVENSGYHMGTRVSLNAIVWVPTIVGHYSLPILQTSDKLDNGSAACVRIICQGSNHVCKFLSFPTIKRREENRTNGKNQVSEKMEHGPELYSQKKSEKSFFRYSLIYVSRAFFSTLKGLSP
jgi:hypothetical protein